MEASEAAETGVKKGPGTSSSCVERSFPGRFHDMCQGLASTLLEGTCLFSSILDTLLSAKSKHLFADQSNQHGLFH